MRALLAPVVALLLSGCWMGGEFYGPGDALRIVPPGRYVATGTRGSPPVTVTIAQLPNGMMQVMGDRDPAMTFGVTSFRGRPDLFITWVDSEGGMEGLYGVLRREPGGVFVYYMPACHRTQELVRAAGGRATGEDGTPSCRFPNRATLETALGRFGDTLEEELPMRFEPLPHG
jgi:hypothetical protein